MSHFQVFKYAIARIFSSKAVIGAGFLVSDRHLLTCAHVVTAALGLSRNTQEMPAGVVDLDFPLLSPGQRVTAKVVFWQAVNPGQVGEDIAVLEIVPMTSGSQPIRLVKADEPWGHSFRIFGFPINRDDGIWAGGVLREHGATQWVQMEDITAQGYQIEPGFSGAPVWDENLNGVVGMAVAAERDREEAKAAFMIPTSILGQTWNGLDYLVGVPHVNSAVSSAEQVRLRVAQNRVSALGEDFAAAHNQLNFTEDEVARGRLNRRIQALDQELEKAEEAFQTLKQKLGID